MFASIPCILPVTCLLNLLCPQQCVFTRTHKSALPLELSDRGTCQLQRLVTVDSAHSAISSFWQLEGASAQPGDFCTAPFSAAGGILQEGAAVVAHGMTPSMIRLDLIRSLVLLEFEVSVGLLQRSRFSCRM